MKLKLYGLLFAAAFPSAACAQDYSTSFNALRLPVSSHTAALGGENVSLIADNPAAGWANPALGANISDLSFGLNFMTYTAGTSWMGAHFAKAFGERHTMMAGAQYLHYGEMDETDETGQVIGKFKAKDIILGIGYSYLLSNRWTGGANLKLIYSGIESYSSFAFSLDIGLNYYNEESDFSVSAAARNIGTQLKWYDEGKRSKLPTTVDLGFSKGVAHLPVRVHVTMTDLTRWSDDDYARPVDKDKKPSFGVKAINHFVLGLDILPTENIYLSLGYNFRRAYELKAAGSSRWAGISAGAGLAIKKLKFDLSYAKYHHAGNSIMAGIGYTL